MTPWTVLAQCSGHDEKREAHNSLGWPGQRHSEPLPQLLDSADFWPSAGPNAPARAQRKKCFGQTAMQSSLTNAGFFRTQEGKHMSESPRPPRPRVERLLEAFTLDDSQRPAAAQRNDLERCASF